MADKSLVQNLNSCLREWEIDPKPYKFHANTAWARIDLERKTAKDGTHELDLRFTLDERSTLEGVPVVVHDQSARVCGAEVIRPSNRNPLVFWVVVKELPSDYSLKVSMLD